MDKKSGSRWRGFTRFLKVLTGLGTLVAIVVGVRSLSSAESTRETKVTTTTTASPSAVASPTQTQTQNLQINILPPAAAPAPAPTPTGPPKARRKAARSPQRSGSGDIKIRDNYGQFNGPGAHDNTLKIEGAEKEEVRRLQKEVEALREYSEIARLNFVGTTGTAGVGLVERSSLSDALAPAVDIVNNRSTYRCDDRAIAIFHEVAEKLPKFPFSYYALAHCLGKKGDEAWKRYGHKAIDILRDTTMINGHHSNHDTALEQLQTALRAN